VSMELALRVEKRNEELGMSCVVFVCSTQRI
ncbi:MAG: hypothetical protein ACI8VT_001719, partial [Saprospiraceae bacterium]